MKRYILIILVMAWAVTLASCTEIRSADSTNNAAVTTIPSNEETKDNKGINALLPEGWSILERFEKLEKVEGDLNKDGIADIAAVIEENNPKGVVAPNRSLLIAFGKNDGSFELSAIAEKAILKADEGGVWGDPLDGISIDRGSIMVNFYGGSNWRWYGSYRFRYQNNDWYLIGATTGSFHTSTNEYTEESDYNLLTGDFILKKADNDGKILTTSGNIGKRDLLRLVDFVAGDTSDQYLK